MIKIAIVEDDLQFMKELESFIDQYKKEREQEFIVEKFTDGDGILEYKKNMFDIIFMDIQMPFVDGMSAAQEIRKKDDKVIIIFVTTAAQYAIKGYTVNAFDYLVKPIEYFAFSEVIRKAIQRVKKDEDNFLVLKVKSGMLRIAVEDIYYIESIGYTLCVHSVQGEYECYGKLWEVEEQLAGKNFARGNRCYLINLMHVREVHENRVVVNRDELQISRGKRKEFLKELMDYWEVKRE